MLAKFLTIAAAAAAASAYQFRLYKGAPGSAAGNNAAACSGAFNVITVPGAPNAATCLSLDATTSVNVNPVGGGAGNVLLTLHITTANCGGDAQQGTAMIFAVPYATANAVGTCTNPNLGQGIPPSSAGLGIQAVSTSATADDGKAIDFFLSDTCATNGGLTGPFATYIQKGINSCTVLSDQASAKTVTCGKTSMSVNIYPGTTCAGDPLVPASTATLSSDATCKKLFDAGILPAPYAGGYSAKMTGACNEANGAGAVAPGATVLTAVAAAAVALFAAARNGF